MHSVTQTWNSRALSPDDAETAAIPSSSHHKAFTRNMRRDSIAKFDQIVADVAASRSPPPHSAHDFSYLTLETLESKESNEIQFQISQNLN